MSAHAISTSTQTRFDEGNQMHELDQIVIFCRMTLELSGLTDPLHSESLDNLADALWNRFKKLGEKRDLEEAILLYREALERRPPSDPLRPNSLNNLSKVLLTRFQHVGHLHLHEAISLPKEALELRVHHSPNPLQSDFLNNLAQALWIRFQEEGHRMDLNNAISLHRQALDLRVAPHPDRSQSLSNLGVVLWTRFLKERQKTDIEESISLQREALNLRVGLHPDRSQSLSHLGLALWTRFQNGGQQTDLEEAYSLHKQALELRALPHPDRPASLSNLASVLHSRFKQNGQQTDLEEAISLRRQALALRVAPYPELSKYLNNLAIVLHTRFEQGGKKPDLDEIISLHRQALEARGASHPMRYQSLNNLALSLWRRFQEWGQKIDREEAISLNRQALDILVVPHSHRSQSLINLAGVLMTRFDEEDQQTDLDESISLLQQALDLGVEVHSNRSQSINNLGCALWKRFQKDGHQIDLEEALSFHRQALGLRDASHPERSQSLVNLGVVLWTRFRQGGQKIDLEEAISLQRQALDLRVPPHLGRPQVLNNLALMLRAQFEQGGQNFDLDEVISLHRQALEARDSPHPLRSQSLDNLAFSLCKRFHQIFRQTDLEEAISLYNQALDLRVPPIPADLILSIISRLRCIRDLQALQLQPLPHTEKSEALCNLGEALIDAHLLSPDKSGHLTEAMEVFHSATQYLNQPASQLLRISRKWIRHAIVHQHISLIEAYDAALQALPKLAALSFDVKSRQEALLTGTDGLARDASRFAIKAGKIEKAIQFLEEGRGVFWSQFLSLRLPVEQLHDIAPELANKLRETASALELGSHWDTLADISDHEARSVIDKETARLNRLNEKWSRILDDIRKLKGFSDFLRPRSLSAFQASASDNPVVILIENSDGSDILILTSADICNIRLPGLSSSELQKLVHLIQAACSGSKIWRSCIEGHSGNTNEVPPAIMETLRSWMKVEEERGMKYADSVHSDNIFKYVLKTLWVEVVRPVIDKLGLKRSEKPPVVQWCLTGRFSFLPIHAAGCYNVDVAVECASSYFVSSQTPTIGALLDHDRTFSTKPFKMMVVIQSRELPSTRKELEKIERHVSGDYLVKLGVPGASATVETVASKLSEVAIVHFSCHGKQDQSNPLDSGLKLEDGWLQVSRIMKEKIPNRALAFLCACETAKGVEKLPDEVMSLGASLLFSGFRCVVATMWEMMDQDGPVIADAFYEELFRGPDGKPAQEPNINMSAYALYKAVKKLRSEKVSFRRWVPFIYMGK